MHRNHALWRHSEEFMHRMFRKCDDQSLDGIRSIDDVTARMTSSSRRHMRMRSWSLILLPFIRITIQHNQSTGEEATTESASKTIPATVLMTSSTRWRHLVSPAHAQHKHLLRFSITFLMSHRVYEFVHHEGNYMVLNTKKVQNSRRKHRWA